jgi:hypothetical protein
MNRALPLLVTLGCLSATRVHAQRATLPDAGSRVRVAIADSLRQEVFLPRTRSLIATLARATPDTLWLHAGGPDTMRVPRSTVRSLDVSRGASRASSALEQGIAVAAIFGIPLYAAADDRDERRRAVAIVGSTAVLAAIVGAVRPYERWRRLR